MKTQWETLIEKLQRLGGKADERPEDFHPGDVFRETAEQIGDLAKEELVPAPIPLLLWCPECGARHFDQGEFATKPHHTHACQECGMVWRPAIVTTVGMQFLPGFKNERRGGR